MTLIETIVAISILLFAITGPMVLAMQSIRATRDARNGLVATHLAEEAFEVVHSMRSNNSADDPSVDGVSWLMNITTNCANGCVIDTTKQQPVNVWSSDVIQACPGGNCDQVSRLYYNASSGLYRQDSALDLAPPDWTQSPFRRFVTMTPSSLPGPGSPYVVNVEVTTYYAKARGGEGKIVISDDIYDWFPQITN
jgi:Tfp pilus assembly protein PilV